MEVPYSSYLVLFHHLLPVSQESVEFPSNCSGSVNSQALQAEMNKMLKKGALELVDNLGPGY